ncbi:hypothetical protein FHS91_003475 [Sphingobium xanthum]|uniref:hypothetical protein n=1 Tax=Sphingobium xanthum TaxID=1387165 RepID=UPI001C8B54F5|nr:hypothetical protein [Sphingobium xanthum]
MTGSRTTRSSVSFKAPFRIPPLDRSLPAGIYAVDTEEEIVEGNERNVYIRVATLLRVQTASAIEIWPVDPAALQAALSRDHVSNDDPRPRPSSSLDHHATSAD